MTSDFGRLGRRFGRQDVAVFIDIEDGPAIGIPAASEEWSESAVLIHHRLAAGRAFMFTYLFFEHFAFLIAGCAEFTVGICRAAQELSVFAEPVNERLFALGAFIFAGGDLGLCVFHLLGGDVEVLFERAVKIL